MANVVCQNHPELPERLAAAKSPAAAAEIAEDFRAAVRETVARQIEARDASRGVEDRAYAAISGLFGLPPGAAVAAGVRFERLVRKAADLVHEIAKGAKGPLTHAEVKKAFRDLVDNHVAALAARMAATDELPLPQERKDAIKVALLELHKVQSIDIARLAEESAKIDSSALDDILQSPAPKPVDVFNAMRPMTIAMRTAIDAMLAGGEEPPGPDDRGGMIMIMAQMIVGARPGLAQRLEAFYERQDVQAAIRPRDMFNRDDPAMPSQAFETVSQNRAVNILAPFHAAIREKLIVAGRELAQFREAGGVDRAASAGYHATEMQTLARAFSLYKAATGCSDADALAAALDPQSKARRLLDYGGRFAQNAGNFREGLRLMDLFHQWYPQVVADAEAGNRNTVTKLIFDATTARASAERGVEKFLFEQIAIDPSLRLDEQDPETIFGMENNKAMRFVGRGYTTSAANTLAGVPPEKRDLIYDVFDALDPLARTADEKAKARPVGNGAMLIARILRNYDDLVDLRTDGLLDRENLVPILYGDLGVTAADDNRRINDVLGEKQMERMDIVLPLMTMMNESGESFNDCVAAIQAGRRLPAAPHVSSANDHLYALDGTAKGGRGTLIGDLIRPTNPKRIGGGLLLRRRTGASPSGSRTAGRSSRSPASSTTRTSAIRATPSPTASRPSAAKSTRSSSRPSASPSRRAEPARTPRTPSGRRASTPTSTWRSPSSSRRTTPPASSPSPAPSRRVSPSTSAGPPPSPSTAPSPAPRWSWRPSP